MKFINNSIGSEYLEDSITEADLEKQMAGCEVKSEMSNGHITDKIKIPESKDRELIRKSTLTNGINGKTGSPAKCNGKENGFYDDEEDFNLVLEDSSEGGDSPSKKNYDDSLSAPQIVQEIEDLLGISSNSAGIQEELNNLDGTESIEDHLDSLEDIEDNSQEIQEPPVEVDEHKVEESLIQKKDVEKSTDNSEVTKEGNRSDVDLVVDKVKVGVEKGDASKPSEESPTAKTDSKVASSALAITDQVKDISEVKLITSQDDKTKNSASSTSDDGLTSSQKSNVSGNSEEWMVLDSIETSEDEIPSEVQCLTQDKPLVQSESKVDELGDAVTKSDNSKIAVDKGETSEALMDCANESLPETKESEPISSSPVLSCEGDKLRKRSASIEVVDIIELKKPRIEDQSVLAENLPVESLPVLKRPSSPSSENENKRTKLHETLEDCKSVGGEKENTIKSDDKIKSVSVEKENTTKSDDNIKFVGGEKENTTKSDDNIDVSCLNNLEKDNKVVDVLSESTEGKKTIECKKTAEENIVLNTSEDSLTSDVISPNASSRSEDVVLSETVTEKVAKNISVQESDTVTFKTSLTQIIEKALQREDDPSLTTLQTEQIATSLKNKSITNSERKLSSSEKVIVSDENNKKDTSCIVDKSKEMKLSPEELPSISSKTCETKKEEPKKSTSFSKEISSSIRNLENKLAGNVSDKKSIKNGIEKAQESNIPVKPEPKKMTNLDFAIERVVEKARIQVEKKVPILKKFHKDQLKKLKRSELEEIIVSKICEAVSYKSEIGQMRLRTQKLEETNEMWRKKVHQIEKQNKELEMVLKRFLNELSHIKRENQNKLPLPFKVTRSVGLQVVLANSMHGALVASRNKSNNEAAQTQEQQGARTKPEKDNAKEVVKPATTFMPPSLSLSKGRIGRPPKTASAPSSRPTTPQLLAPKVTPPSTPVKQTTTTPVKIIQTPNKELEVIDLTDKEERAKASQATVGGQIRVAPSTQVCFVQQNSTTSPPQQPLYLVQKPGQRPQFIVATSTPSPQRPGSTTSRPPPALALPAVFRAGGHLIPVQTSPQGNVKPINTTQQTAVARVPVPSGMHMKQQTTTHKHPAPLPPAPAIASKPGMKAPPPKPQLKIAKTNNGIMLSWSMSLSKDIADMQSYQLYAYQEGNQPPSTQLWKKVGDVKALPLPMACTLTQFIEGHKYHFAVRAVDSYGRIGPFSSPSSILLSK
ncbi:activating transcription factor 7-interacting protein 1 isoform X2 [Macrosteles quadrilineatus]|uniref:activating transcription factor 7-interacting protein 1 isoform X2 n=1 Tax=Macrosteles quadrilineatus TaxID=74068 RepID=UPI0023E0EF3B|nr:activating transcription factor 7-interacting protein 1 isoform X2 [Macrosteles quadrilineatus]